MSGRRMTQRTGHAIATRQLDQKKKLDELMSLQGDEYRHEAGLMFGVPVNVYGALQAYW